MYLCFRSLSLYYMEYTQYVAFATYNTHVRIHTKTSPCTYLAHYYSKKKSIRIHKCIVKHTVRRVKEAERKNARTIIINEKKRSVDLCVRERECVVLNRNRKTKKTNNKKQHTTESQCFHIKKYMERICFQN